jgi:cystathionine beta-lyase
MNPLGIVATQAAYNHGEPWLEEAISYIAKNFEFLENFIRKHIPSLKVLPLEATYLSWIDCRELELTQDRLDRLVMEEAHIYVDEGYLFGPEGSGFIRLNLACPRSIVEKALQRLKASIDNLDAGRA